MRIYIAISVAIHVLIVAWLLLGPGARALDPASAEPILVDLVPPQDASAKTDQESAKPDQDKSDETKSDPPKPDPAPPAARKTDTKTDAKTTKTDPKIGPKPDLTSASPKPNGAVEAPPYSAEEQGATAARLAWMLNLPVETEVSLTAPPSEGKSNLSRDEIANFKAQIGKCWQVPADVPTTAGFDVLIRIALRPNGMLGAKPELIRAPASLAGPALVDAAKQALQKCQPYATLPADRYQDWKILELTFTADGPTGLSGPPSGTSAR